MSGSWDFRLINYLGIMRFTLNYSPVIFIIFLLACQQKSDPTTKKVVLPNLPELTESVASGFVDLSLHCVDLPYPYKIGYRFPSEEWVKPHTEVHPSFYGCWDWHSAVHGHWAMIKVLKTFPNIKEKDSIRLKLRANLTQENLSAEYDFFAKESFTGGFERTYGWAWLLKLYAELASWDDQEGQQWKQNMQPLAELLSQKTIDYLKVLSSPLRPGTHANTAFSFGLMTEYAMDMDDTELLDAMKAFSRQHFLSDKTVLRLMNLLAPTSFHPAWRKLQS